MQRHTEYDKIKWYRDDVTIDDYESDYEDEDFSYERREFVGRVAKSDVSDKYIHKSVEQFYGNGKRNPIRYIMNRVDDEGWSKDSIIVSFGDSAFCTK